MGGPVGRVHAGVVRQDPAGVVGDLPAVAVGVDEDPGRVVPKRPADSGSGRPAAVNTASSSVGGRVVRQRDATPPTIVRDRTVMSSDWRR
jgi:hypothetical protein